eukprot:1828789-Pleurochrysis_carterae.AAC.1
MVLYESHDLNISFSTVECEHTPKVGVPGFFGTFEKKKNPGYDKHDPHKGLMFVRHQAVGRNSILLYIVKTFTEKVAMAGIERAKKVVRIAKSSLERLAAVHLHGRGRGSSGGRAGRGGDSDGSSGGRGRGQGRGRGGQAAISGAHRGRTSNAAAGGNNGDGQPRTRRQLTSDERTDGNDDGDNNGSTSSNLTPSIDSSNDDLLGDMPAAARAANKPAATDAAGSSSSGTGSSSRAKAATADTDDDSGEPPPIPEGFKMVDWTPGSALPVGQELFMIWTCLGGRRMPSWQRVRVLEQLESGRSDAFTHDALFSFDRRQYPRGVSLSFDLYSDGCWVLICACTAADASLH